MTVSVPTVLTLSRLVGLSQPGPDAGRCYLCGELTTAGHREAPSETFTAWAQVYAGDVLCPSCYPLVHDRRFRSRSWLATSQGVRFAEPGEDRTWLRATLTDPPDPPFALYLTKGHRKQGWITLLRYVSQSRERFWVGTDWLDRPVLLERAWVHAVLPLLDRLVQRGVGKTALRTGLFPAAVWRRAIQEGWGADLDTVWLLAGDPRWEVTVYACDTRDGRKTGRAPGRGLPPDPVAEDPDEQEPA